LFTLSCLLGQRLWLCDAAASHFNYLPPSRTAQAGVV
jgi:hypothetical protein